LLNVGKIAEKKSWQTTNEKSKARKERMANGVEKAI